MTDRTALLNDFVAGVIAENPLHANFINASRATMSRQVREELVDYIEYCLKRGLALAYLIDCYNTIVIDTQMEQIYFKKHNRYRCQTFKEAAERVYFDDTYMKKYMYGLAITSFLWPNHAAMHEFFVSTFPKGLSGTYLEIGPGHGYYFRQAGMLGRFEKMIGVDISPTSVALTKDIVEYMGIGGSRAEVQIVERNFLDMKSGDADYSCIVMGEVLEHVEDPGLFVSTIARLSGGDTHVYLTTCVNAPAIDHISLFRTTDEVEDLIRANGLGIKQALRVPSAGKTLEECESRQLAVNVAYALRKS